MPRGVASCQQRRNCFPAGGHALADRVSEGRWTVVDSAEHVPVDELLRRQGVRPIESVDELARPDLFESDDELAEFITMVYADRRTGLA